MADEFDANEFLSEVGIEDNGSDLVKKLRKAVESLGKEKKALADQLATIAQEKAEAALEVTWKDLGVPESHRGLYHGDKNADAIKTWWEANKALFNVPADSGTATETQAPAEQQELQQVTNVAALGTDTPGSLTADAVRNLAETASKLSAHNNPKELADFYAKLGIPKGVINVPHAG